ncbi:uncharacterized protein F5Z01DRAFT_637705 [Emericellopsis atlantica]|uniref:Uncharacterized protein n=1 Tax=Emericellopsis atlantica TaxID=2614577 RepID=A0A9P7ZJM2_9HYPO|nr:uncharacterized protein F5Z01DRAFT_637705 [Emericellopsis atlantica]KAG9252952.1 hypothetical protein F5Z01DRAFT_637705 [Emericellopsis atlantica]
MADQDTTLPGETIPQSSHPLPRQRMGVQRDQALPNPQPWPAPQKLDWDLHVSTRTASRLHRVAVHKSITLLNTCLQETEALAVAQSSPAAVESVYPEQAPNLAEHQLNSSDYWDTILSLPKPEDADLEHVTRSLRRSEIQTSTAAQSEDTENDSAGADTPLPTPTQLTVAGSSQPSHNETVDSSISMEDMPAIDNEQPNPFDNMGIPMDLDVAVPSGIDSVQAEAPRDDGAPSHIEDEAMKDDNVYFNDDEILSGTENTAGELLADWLESKELDKELLDAKSDKSTKSESLAGSEDLSNTATSFALSDSTDAMDTGIEIPFLPLDQPVPRVLRWPSPEWIRDYPSNDSWPFNLYDYLFRIEKIRRNVRSALQQRGLENTENAGSTMADASNLAGAGYDDGGEEEDNVDGRFDLLQMQNNWNADVAEDVIEFFNKAGPDATLISAAHLRRLKATVAQLGLMVRISATAITRREKMPANRNHLFQSLHSVRGDKSHVMHSKGLGSTLREVISVDEPWPEAWEVGLLRPERRKLFVMGKKEYQTSKKDDQDGLFFVGAGEDE